VLVHKLTSVFGFEARDAEKDNPQCEREVVEMRIMPFAVAKTGKQVEKAVRYRRRPARGQSNDSRLLPFGAHGGNEERRGYPGMEELKVQHP
jgi:hypothetical protein